MKFCKRRLEEASGGACDLQTTKNEEIIQKNGTKLAATACIFQFGLFHSQSACQLCLYPVAKNDYRRLKISETLLKGRGPEDFGSNDIDNIQKFYQIKSVTSEV